MKLITTVVFFLSILGFSSAQNLITDRPDQTESASVVGNGTFQLETGSAYSFAGESVWSINNSLFRIGASNKLEFRIATDLSSIGRSLFGDIDDLGLSDLELGFKYQFFSGNVDLAYMGHVILPTGSPKISSDHWGYTQRINMDGQFSERVGFGVNFGYDYFSSDERYFTATYVIGFEVNTKVGLFVEYFGEFDRYGQSRSNFDLGFTYLFSPNLQFDFSTGGGINENTNFISWGLSWRVPKS